jgi:hypothetical protein
MSTKNDLSCKVEIEHLKILFKIACRTKQCRPKNVPRFGLVLFLRFTIFFLVEMSFLRFKIFFLVEMSRVIVCKLGRFGELRKVFDWNTSSNPIGQSNNDNSSNQIGQSKNENPKWFPAKKNILTFLKIRF